MKNSFPAPKYLVILILAAFNATSTYGTDFAKLKSKFPNENVAYLNQKHHYIITDKNGKLTVTDNAVEETAYLNSNDLQLSSDAIYYTSFSTISNINAYTESPTGKGGRNKTMEVSKFDTKSVMGGGVFYDDRQKIAFTFPGVVEGAVTHLEYTETFNDAHMIDAFHFTNRFPVEYGELKVTFPSTVKIAYSLFGEDTSKIKFAVSHSGSNTTYTWSANDEPSIIFEPNSPHYQYFEPHVIVRIASYEVNGKTTPFLSDTKDLYKWYSSLVGEINKTDEAELKATVTKLTTGLDDRGKAKAIYQWVQSNVNYVAFEDGMGGLVPRDAANVCNKKYGDCKDMANLLRQMLNYAGLDASLAWIGTRHLPYTYDKVPTPIVDNHMICAVRLNGNTIFLDATGKYIPFGLPSPFTQGKEALVGINKDEYKIVKVPIVDKEMNVKYDSTSVTIANRDLKGSAHTHLSGFEKLTFDYLFYGGTFKNEGEFLGAYLNKGSNKFQIGDHVLKGLTDPDKETDIDYTYTIPDYIKVSGTKIYVNLNLDKPLRDETLDLEKRHHAREFEYKFISRNKVMLDVPDGYSVEYLPPAASFEGKDYGFSCNYKKEGNKIVLDKQVFINTLFIQKANFKDWNDCIAKLNGAFKETVVLTKELP